MNRFVIPKNKTLIPPKKMYQYPKWNHITNVHNERCVSLLESCSVESIPVFFWTEIKDWGVPGVQVALSQSVSMENWTLHTVIMALIRPVIVTPRLEAMEKAMDSTSELWTF